MKKLAQYQYFLLFVVAILSVIFFGGALGGFFISKALTAVPIWLWGIFIIAIVWMVK